jgi:hypothetical protein
MSCSVMWRRVDILLTDVSEELVYSYLLTLVHRSWISYTLQMEAIRPSETSVNRISTLRHIPEDGILLYQTNVYLYGLYYRFYLNMF